jgi:N-acyl homoserine lactone hydrolase
MPRSPSPLWLCLLLIVTVACKTTTHDAKPGPFGVPRATSALLSQIDQPGPLTLETVVAADWSVDRGGVINLDHPKAKAAHLQKGDEPIQIFYHVIRHPTRGMLIVDTGMERAMRDQPDHAAISGVLASVFGVSRMRFERPLGQYLMEHKERLKGVFLTHMHIDHVAGMPDVPQGTPIYAGPGEAQARSLMNLATQSVTNRLFEGQLPVLQFAFEPDSTGRFKGVLDLFGDGSFWALYVPGHTAGSVAYVARTTTGPVLMTGDTCHTAWGWNNDVEPGSYTADSAANIDSLARLRRLAREHETMRVLLGHQSLTAASP